MSKNRFCEGEAGSFASCDSDALVFVKKLAGLPHTALQREGLKW